MRLEKLPCIELTDSKLLNNLLQTGFPLVNLDFIG